jgi:hypothetical protein
MHCSALARNKLTVVCEEFEHRHEKFRAKIDYTSKEYIGVVHLFAAKMPSARLVMQSASQAKQFWTDEKVKHVGLWHPGMKHANDAMRHYLWFMSFRIKDSTFIELLRDFN